ncbi:unnamed protein product, partial [Rotaria sp. Silwood2]
MFENFYYHVREQLFQLLSSKNEYIHVHCCHYWCDRKHLSISSHHRLVALVDRLYSIKTENEHLNYSINFLLQRSAHNPDYNRFIQSQTTHDINITTMNPVHFMQTLTENNNKIDQQ